MARDLIPPQPWPPALSPLFADLLAIMASLDHVVRRRIDTDDDGHGDTDIAVREGANELRDRARRLALRELRARIQTGDIDHDHEGAGNAHAELFGSLGSFANAGTANALAWHSPSQGRWKDLGGVTFGDGPVPDPIAREQRIAFWRSELGAVLAAIPVLLADVATSAASDVALDTELDSDFASDIAADYVAARAAFLATLQERWPNLNFT